MSVKAPDPLGDRMKIYERRETTDRFMPTLPIYARLDGRGFSKFTKGMVRPFDERMSKAMIETVRRLVEHTHALMGYTQSDEISLVWHVPNIESDVFFDGKKQKMVSVLASLATAYFTRAILDIGGDFAEYAKKMPHFDARVFQLPSRTETANAVLWRERDATKNAISMAASHYFSHKKLLHRNSAQKMEMLAEEGVVFADYPQFFKHGTFLRRVTAERTLTTEERSRIPENKQPPEGHTFMRSSVQTIDMPPFNSVLNRTEVIFDGAEPVVIGDE